MSGFWSGLGRLSVPLEWSTPLGGAAWAALLAVPIGIIALYFLKLRRRPVRVPSTLLWRRSLEDLHVNSLFQRLRRNLLLFLQLLAVALVILALAGPRTRGTGATGQRFVLMIDNSASMSATDVAPNRLARARDAAKKVVAAMSANDLAMVIAFADSARVVSNYTGDKRALARRIDAIAPTQAPTSLREGLQVAAGLANPAKQIGEGVVASSVVTPKLFIYTDGGFADVEGFSLGNLEPQVVVIGPPPPPYERPETRAGASGKSEGPAAADERGPSDNVAVLALQSRRDDEKPGAYQLFGRVRNYRGEAIETEAQLYRHDVEHPGDAGELVDAIALKMGPRGEESFKFDLVDPGLAAYEVRLTIQDALAVDNRAYAIVGATRKAQVLVVTAGNRYLADTLKTPLALQRAEVATVTPEGAKRDPVARDVEGGRYDLVVYDGTRPEKPPQANALYFGAFPPGPAYAEAKDVRQPVVLDWDISHPMMQFVRDLSLVYIARARTLELPSGAKSLIDSNHGPLAFLAPREGFTDAVVTFPLLDGTAPNTTWFRYISFPLFVLNSIQTLGNVREGGGPEARPGAAVTLRAETIEREIRVRAPGRDEEAVPRSPQGTFVFHRADAAGLYLARWGDDGRLPFAVNLFDPRESDLAPRGLVPEGAPEGQAESYKIKIGYNPVTGARTPPRTSRDIWWYFALQALGVLLIEWYIYNRRVYI